LLGTADPREAFREPHCVDLSARDWHYFEGVVILLELSAVTIEEILAPE
jgi:hypothetical protein